ncbi:hypothetical protein ID866_13101, partial [Astraeus odoratus]
MYLYSTFVFAAVCLSYSAPVVANGKTPGVPRASQNSVLGPVSSINIVNEVVSPDGFSRSAVLAGGSFPGPLIQAYKGDNFAIEVSNQLVDDSMPVPTSVHWHGIFQQKSSWADGASFITQCPIPANRSFLYQFNAADQTGTYWYHSHYTTQYCDGLRGPLIIYDPDDPLGDMYDVDDENTVITLSDWYHNSSSILGEITGAVIPDSTLING